MIEYSIPPLVTSILFIICGIYLCLLKKFSKISLIFLALCLATFGWQFTWFFLFNFHRYASLLVKLGYASIIFIPITYYHFVTCILALEKENKRLIMISYCIGVAFFILLWLTNWYINGYYTYYWGPYPKASILHPLYLLFLAFLVYKMIADMIYALQHLNLCDQRKNQIKFLLASLIIYTFASCDFLANYGIKFYPIGFAFVICSNFILLYAVITHKLMDAPLIIKNSLFTAMLSTVCFIPSLFFTFLTDTFIDNFYLKAILFSFIAVILSFYIGRIRIRTELAIRRLFYKKRTEQMVYIEQMASSLAHEIRNPLQPIRTYLEALEENPGDADFVREMVRTLSPYLDRMQTLVNQLMHLGKMDKPLFAPADPHQSIDEALKILEPKLKVRKIDVVKNYALHPPTLQADKNQLSQVYFNLIKNAMEAMPKGGTLTVTTEKILNNTKPVFRISIKDTGLGMDKTTLEKIFEPFYTTKAEKGTGLGLSISKQIIESHSGKITANSVVGGGTEFSIELPLDG